MKFYDNLLHYCIQTSSLESDNQETKLKKAFILMLSLVLGLLGIIWGLLYITLDHFISAIFPLAFTLNSILSLWYLKKTKNIVLFLNIQITLLLLLPFFLMWSLGGFVQGSFVMIWAFFAPITALIYSTKQSIWFYAFIVLTVFSILIDSQIQSQHTSLMSDIAIERFFILNICGGLSGIYLLIKHFIKEQDKSAHKTLKIEHDKLLKQSKELSEANTKLAHYASHDSLTDLPNRNNLRNHIEKRISLSKESEESMALLFIDLDNFKNVNDTFGHAKGDEILKAVSERLSSLLREGDIVARIGGDEFAVTLNKISDISYVENISKRIIDEINRDYPFIKETSPIGASIGISIFPKDAKDIDTLINLADEAMYNIKKSSKNSFLFYSKD